MPLTRHGSRSQLLTGAATAVAWRLAIAEFLCLSLVHMHFPLPAGILALIVGFITTDLVNGRGWRIIQTLVVQLGGYVLSCLVTIYIAMPWSHPFLSTGWISELILGPKDVLGWFTICMYAGLTMLFWWGGWFLVHGKRKFFSYYARFDIGMSFFVVLFLAKFFLKQRADMVIDDPAAMPAFISFLIFGLLSIGATLRSNRVGRIQSDYLPGYKTVGLTAAFAGLVILIGFGLAALFMPYLTQAADVGYLVLTTVSRPMGHFITALLRVMFTRSRRLENNSAAGSRGEDALPENALMYGQTIPEWVVYMLLAVCCLVVLMGLAYLTWLLINWLLSRTPQRRASGDASLWLDLLHLLRSAGRTLLDWAKAAFSWKGRKLRCSGYWYGLLLKWGRRSGIAHMPTETPREYVLRLKARFPMLGSEMDAIVALFNLETYGGWTMEPAGRRRAAAAWRRIRSPRYWPRRWYGWVRRL